MKRLPATRVHTLTPHTRACNPALRIAIADKKKIGRTEKGLWLQAVYVGGKMQGTAKYTQAQPGTDGLVVSSVQTSVNGTTSERLPF